MRHEMKSRYIPLKVIVSSLLGLFFLINIHLSVNAFAEDDPAIIEEKPPESIEEIKTEPYLDDYAEALNFKDFSEPEFNYFPAVRMFERGYPHKKLVALTFDDGPHQDYTPQILRILKENNVKATFFVVGLMVRRYPYLIRAEYLAGHEIGNHTNTHENLKLLPDIDIKNEIIRCGEAIEEITGKKPQLFRPAGGNHSGKIIEIANSLGYTVVLWSIDTADYNSPSDSVIISRIMSKVKNGSIILMHDGIQSTIDALPVIISKLRGEGYEFVTVSELMQYSIKRN